jgi:4-hydroxy-tetrahydrodipicolinate synthase
MFFQESLMTADRRVRGVWTAVLTPLTADGTCDVDRLARHCQALLAAGIDGVAPFGTTGEGPSFTVRERRTALDGLIEAGIPAERILPGTGCAALPDTIELTRHAVAHGCIGTLMLPPFYFKDPDDDGIARAFSEVVDRTGGQNLRLYLYHIPQTSVVPVTPTVVDTLVRRYPGIIAGVKDSSGDWANGAALIERFPQLSILLGAEHLLPQALRAGGAGTICGLANIAPALIRQLHDARDRKRLEPLLARTQRLVETMTALPFVSAVKAIMAERSGEPGWSAVRAPLTPFTATAGRHLLGEVAPLLDPAT